MTKSKIRLGQAFTELVYTNAQLNNNLKELTPKRLYVALFESWNSSKTPPPHTHTDFYHTYKMICECICKYQYKVL